MIISVNTIQKVLKYIPTSVYYGIANVLYFVGFRLSGYRKAVVRKNIRQAFPEKSEKECLKIEQQFFHHLCDYIVETALLSKMDAQELSRRITFNNADLLNDYYDQGKNVVLTTGHQANWEWMALMPKLLKFKSSAVYRQQSADVSDQIILQNRSKFGFNMIKDKELIAYLKNQPADSLELIYMLCDQRPQPTKRPKVLKFMHQPTAVFQGLDFIARKFDYEVVYAQLEKTSRGHYEVTFRPLDPQEGETPVECFFQKLEDSIRHQPFTYLWSHNRWKNPPVVE
ncbi:lysophospholipid acyltransferase family protein [Persicobacter psychrovividus]|uniref:Lipid A biosynthesis protein n=1 Tax=Persicobacter psychrovividus TaxID=387638 RepID=A0ABM7VG72_9BACT|nr:lipid A biosynthesis protein [Persicobacter psychrovividus]